MRRGGTSQSCFGWPETGGTNDVRASVDARRLLRIHVGSRSAIFSRYAAFGQAVFRQKPVLCVAAVSAILHILGHVRAVGITRRWSEAVLSGPTFEFMCEISCDAEITNNADADARRRYSETIIGVVNPKARFVAALSTSFYSGKKGMKKRISSIMDAEKKRAGQMNQEQAISATKSAADRLIRNHCIWNTKSYSAHTHPNAIHSAMDAVGGFSVKSFIVFSISLL